MPSSELSSLVGMTFCIGAVYQSRGSLSALFGWNCLHQWMQSTDSVELCDSSNFYKSAVSGMKEGLLPKPWIRAEASAHGGATFGQVVPPSYSEPSSYSVLLNFQIKAPAT